MSEERVLLERYFDILLFHCRKAHYVKQQSKVTKQKEQQDSRLPSNTVIERCDTSVVSSLPVFVAKCAECNVITELKVCEHCQYPKCGACIEKHRQAEKTVKIDSLRKQTGKSKLQYS